MEFVLHGLSAALVVTAVLAAVAAGMSRSGAARAPLYNVQRDAARRR